MKPDFTIGDRVRMTALGASRCMRLADRMGTIVGRSIYTNSFSVRFDGNKSSSTLHRDYLEVIVKADLVDARTRPAHGLNAVQAKAPKVALMKVKGVKRRPITLAPSERMQALRERVSADAAANDEGPEKR
jgi:hypothetical protein